MTPLEKDPDKSAKEYALRRLDRRECSAKDIYRHLIKKGVSSQVASHVVSDLVASNLISDERFAKMLTRAQVSRGKGPQVIRQKLREKGISLELSEVKAVSEEVGQMTELQAAQAVLERKYPRAAEDRAEANRAYQALIRRGFSYEVAQESLRFIKTHQKNQ